MHKLRLTYFDIDGGRGEVARLAAFIGGIPLEDNRVKFQDWLALKPSMPFGAMPLLEVDGQTVAQSNGINRFVGKLAGLYPADPLQAALCDEAMDAVEDITHEILATFPIQDPEEKKAKREALAEGPLTFYLQRFEQRLKERGGEYFADGRLTVADLKVFLWIRHLKSGTLDHLPADLPDRVAPLLTEHYQRVKSHPKVAEYYESRRKG
jgi:prostaglandin-H2 D-isomerase / glutathione transferase